MPARIHRIVRGRVQGVGFRPGTLRKARSLRLNGWVRNLPNGDVEVECEGGPESLEQMAVWLRRGPAGAEVQDCAHMPPTESPPYSEFEIRY